MVFVQMTRAVVRRTPYGRPNVEHARRWSGRFGYPSRRPYRPTYTSVPRNRFGVVGSSMRTTFKWCQQTSINPGIGAIADKVFRANDLYDPDYTGVGHQPYGFDQLMTLYSHYTVLGSKIKVVFMNASGYKMGYNVKVDAWFTHGATALDNLFEQKGGVHCLSGPDNSGGYRDKTLTNRVNVSEFFGLTPRTLLASSVHRGTAGGSATEGVFYIVSGAAIDTLADPGITYMMVEIEYDAVLSEPKGLAAS